MTRGYKNWVIDKLNMREEKYIARQNQHGGYGKTRERWRCRVLPLLHNMSPSFEVDAIGIRSSAFSRFGCIHRSSQLTIVPQTLHDPWHKKIGRARFSIPFFRKENYHASYEKHIKLRKNLCPDTLHGKIDAALPKIKLSKSKHSLSTMIIKVQNSIVIVRFEEERFNNQIWLKIPLQNHQDNNLMRWLLWLSEQSRSSIE